MALTLAVLCVLTVFVAPAGAQEPPFDPPVGLGSDAASSVLLRADLARADLAGERTPMLDVADRRAPARRSTTAVLLVANAVMLGIGAVMLWRRCATPGTDHAR